MKHTSIEQYFLEEMYALKDENEDLKWEKELLQEEITTLKNKEQQEVEENEKDVVMVVKNSNEPVVRFDVANSWYLYDKRNLEHYTLDMYKEALEDEDKLRELALSNNYVNDEAFVHRDDAVANFIWEFGDVQVMVLLAFYGTTKNVYSNKINTGKCQDYHTFDKLEEISELALEKFRANVEYAVEEMDKDNSE